MNMISGFYTGFSVIVLAALVAMVAVFAAWTVQFFARNRAERLAQRRPLVAYYRNLGSHSFAH